MLLRMDSSGILCLLINKIMEQKSNKTIVLECYRKIIRDVDLSLVDSYVNDNYIQHSPSIKDGKVGLIEMMTFLKKYIIRTLWANANLMQIFLNRY